MIDTVDLFLLASVLVLLDHVAGIIVDRCACNDTGLMSAVHDELVDVVASVGIGDKGSVGDPRLKKLLSLTIYDGIVSIYGIGELCLCSVYTKESKLVFSHLGFSFLSVINIIR